MELFVLSVAAILSVVGLSYYGLWIGGFMVGFVVSLIASRHWIALAAHIGVMHGVLLEHIAVIVLDTDWKNVLKTEPSTIFSLAPLALGGAKGMFIVGACVGSVAGGLYSIPYRDGAEKDGSREWRWFRERLFWRIVQSLFQLQVEFDNPSDAEIDFGSTGAMFCISPHGLFNFGGVLSAAFHGGRFPDFPRLHCAVTSVVFSIPFVADVAKWGGCIDASRQVVGSKLRESEHVGLAPGGVQEMIVQKSNEVDLYLDHEGFIRLALESRHVLVPVYCRGENRIFLTWSRWPKVQRFFAKRILYPFPAIYLGPFREPLTVFIGSPIRPSEDLCAAYALDGGEDAINVLKTAYYAELGKIVLARETYPINADLKEYLEECISSAPHWFDTGSVSHWKGGGGESESESESEGEGESGDEDMHDC
jgi:2-acylglycerol O-acyltransferase 2